MHEIHHWCTLVSQWAGPAVLVRLGYAGHLYLAFRASLWFLKIVNGESDPLLLEQWHNLCNNDEELGFTSMYKGCKSFLERLNEFSDENIFTCPPSRRRKVLSDAIFRELTIYWRQLDEAKLTRSIHDQWSAGAMPSAMFTRYTHCVYHNLALGRGPLRAVIFRDHDDSHLRCCRHGCDAEETAEHVLLHCPFVRGRRMDLAGQLQDMKKDLQLPALLATEFPSRFVVNCDPVSDLGALLKMKKNFHLHMALKFF